MSTLTAFALPSVPAGATWVDADTLVHDNYRSAMDDVHVRALAADIAASGLRSLPCVERLTDGTHRVVWGNTRVVAMRGILGMTEVPVEVASFADEASRLAAQVRENELRREVSIGDRCRVAARMRALGVGDDGIAAAMAVTTQRVRLWVRMAEGLCAAALEDLSAGVITPAMAQDLLRVPLDRQSAPLELARSHRFSVRAWSELLDRIVAAVAEDATTGLFDADAFALQVEAWAADAVNADAQLASARRTRAELEAEVARLRAELDVMHRAPVVDRTVPRRVSEWRDRIVHMPKAAYLDGCVHAWQCGTAWPDDPGAPWAAEVRARLERCGVRP